MPLYEEKVLLLSFQLFRIMKQTFSYIALLFAFAFFMGSCSTKVDLYADYKDIPVVYGLFDITKDTNYVKIIRAFSGNDEVSINANEIALIPDSNNYPGKLDVRIYEEKNSALGNTFTPTGRVFVLDTMTIHDKEPGVFYAPDQKVYFTTGTFKSDGQGGKYRYRLEIVKGNDTISAATSIVGGSEFRVTTSVVNFVPGNTSPAKIAFKPAENAFLYEARMEFNYKEKLPGQEMKDKKVEWSLGTYYFSELSLNNGVYELNYNHETLFKMLENAIGDETLNVQRVIGDFNIKIAAGGSELYNYIEVNTPSSSISQNISDYTNINGGYGVLSSRINITKTVNLSSTTITSLIEKAGWGFQQSGN